MGYLRELFSAPIEGPGVLGDVLLSSKELTANARKSFFASCERDAKGHCEFGGGSSQRRDDIEPLSVLGSGPREDRTVFVPDAEGEDAVVKVTINPSPEGVKNWLKNLRGSPLKLLIHGNDLAAWDEEDVHHVPVSKVLEWPDSVKDYRDRVMAYHDREADRYVIDKLSEGNEKLKKWADTHGFVFNTESYFASCERDSKGHCEAEGEASKIQQRRSAIETGKIVAATYVGGNGWHLPNGKPVPAHVAAVKIPRGMHDVRVSLDPKSELVARGVDAKGREKRFYADTYAMAQAAAKFSRISELMSKEKEVRQRLERDGAAGNDHAACLLLIHATGIRPGSNKDTGGKVRAYGATTLEGRHVKVAKDRSVTLDFVGKEGVHLRIPVHDKLVASMLRVKKRQAGSTGKLFATSANNVQAYSHSLDGGHFLPKDFRTLKGTKTALALANAAPRRAKTMAEYRKRVKEVAVAVSKLLGNTPAMALKAYINPAVFTSWKPEEK